LKRSKQGKKNSSKSVPRSQQHYQKSGLEKIKAGEKELFQVSSKITATLPKEWENNIGTLLSQVLPAGSITGTPKKSTVNIINRVEDFDRGFYANLPGAKERIMTDAKEMAEHVMIVDLMRNDLGIIGKDVKVEKFRYVEKIKAGEKELFQVSSKITATLPKEWENDIGTLLSQILPAGSITGTPKKSTVNIINRVEDFNRGFYTGVFGVFDGRSLRSGVMIRFIEKEDEKLYYKSGGGITIDSNAKSEYEELIDKIYLPF